MVTSGLLEAFLACSLKCHLLSAGERPAGTEYSSWAAAREECYRRDSIQKLTSQETNPGVASSKLGLWKSESWQFAVGETVRARGWEAEVALIQRIPQTVVPSQFVPIHFVANNRLSASDKTIAAFEALSLAKALGSKTGTAKIVHGKNTTLSVNAAASSRAVHRKVSQVASLLSATSPPDTVVNRHCPECGFHDRCRKDAVGKDDLSLLSNLTGKERARYRAKGIFTVSQLAYIFRPRRCSKHLAARPEKYHHALKALAIHERKILLLESRRSEPHDFSPVSAGARAFADAGGSPHDRLEHLDRELRTEIPR